MSKPRFVPGDHVKVIDKGSIYDEAVGVVKEVTRSRVRGVNPLDMNKKITFTIVTVIFNESVFSPNLVVFPAKKLRRLPRPDSAPKAVWKKFRRTRIARAVRALWS